MPASTDHKQQISSTTGIVVPVPDPTTLTTQQLLREMSMFREVIDTRFHAMDKAVTLLQSMAEKSPTTSVLDAQLESLKAQTEEKFNSIRIQFAERDTRTEQTSRDSKVAVDAALQAAKEAVGEQNKSSALAIAKSEAATTKQIDQIGILISTTTKGTDEKIDDLKSRLTIMEGHKKGAGDVVGYVMGIIGLLATVISVIMIFAVRR